jgi:hypothetical protein
VFRLAPFCSGPPFGAPSNPTDTLLEERFAQSSQAYWVTKCTGCNHYNVPTPEEGVLDMIQPNGPCCCKCGKLLDKWVKSSSECLHKETPPNFCP